MKSCKPKLRILFLFLLVSATTRAANNPRPFVHQPLVPVSAAPGGSAFTLTVRGVGFVAGAVVDWNGQALSTSFVSSIELTAQVPAADIAQAGTASVTAVNPAPGGGESNVVFFPVATSISPTFTFRLPGHLYVAGFNPGQVTTGDFNGDGVQDLAVALGSNPGRIAVLLGKGDGTFQPAVEYAAEGFPTCVAVGDINGDGKLDLISDGSSNQIAVLLGNGDGTFQSPLISQSPSAGPYDVALADFNRDGYLDVAVTGCCFVSVLLGKGDGTFQRDCASYRDPGGPVAVTVGDFNQDDNLDLAIANTANNTFSVLLGKGDGTFTQPVSRSVGPSGSSPQAVVTADFNGDGILDLAVGNALDTSAVAILLGNGDGTFGPATVYGGSTYGIALGDLNDDGKLDLALAENAVDGVLFGNGNGTLGSYGTFGVGNFETLALAIADFNGDGRLDLVFSDYQQHTIDVLLQTSH